MKLGIGIGIGWNQRRRGDPPVITRLTAAVIGPYADGDLPTDAYAPGTYDSTAGTITSVGAAWTVNGTAWDEVTALAEGDEVRLTETPTDNATPPNSLPFPYGPVTVAAGVLPPAVLSDLMINDETGAVTLDSTEDGTLYLDIRQTSAEAPTVAQMVAGTGAEVTNAPDGLVVGAGEASGSLNISGLDAEVEYTLRAVLIYDTDKESNVVSTVFERAPPATIWAWTDSFPITDNLNEHTIADLDIGAHAVGRKVYLAVSGPRVSGDYEYVRLGGVDGVLRGGMAFGGVSNWRTIYYEFSGLTGTTATLAVKMNSTITTRLIGFVLNTNGYAPETFATAVTSDSNSVSASVGVHAGGRTAAVTMWGEPPPADPAPTWSGITPALGPVPGFANTSQLHAHSAGPHATTETVSMGFSNAGGQAQGKHIAVLPFSAVP